MKTVLRTLSFSLLACVGFAATSSFAAGLAPPSPSVAIDVNATTNAVNPVVNDAVEGMSDFVLNSEVASLCGWTTKDHVKLEQTRDQMIHNSLDLLVKQGDLSVKETEQVMHTVTSVEFLVLQEQKALTLQKEGVCTKLQVKVRWDVLAAAVESAPAPNAEANVKAKLAKMFPGGLPFGNHSSSTGE